MRVKHLIEAIVLCFLLMGMVVNAEVNHAEPDGENGYYRNAPEIVMKHTTDGIMRYRLEDANGEVLSGRMDSSMSTVTIQSGILKDGENILDTWLEKEDGSVIEESMECRKFLVDQVPPEFPLHFLVQDVLEISAIDKCSGVAGIYYAIEGEEFQYVKGDRVFYSLPEFFEGRICAYAVDQAGNVGEKCFFTIEPKKEVVVEKLPNSTKEPEKDEKAPSIELFGLPEQKITNQSVILSCVVKDNRKVTELRGNITRENQDGLEECIEITEWKKNENGYQFERELAEEGIYQIKIEAKDEEGNNQNLCEQVIIDWSSPLISSIRELSGKQMTEFVWKYDVEEIISDLTSFSVEVRLDGILCKKNHIYNVPGIHLLEVTACDLAGNQVKESVQFSIMEAHEEVKQEETEKKDVIEEGGDNKNEIQEERKVPLEEKESPKKILPIFIGGFAGILLMVLLGMIAAYKREEAR